MPAESDVTVRRIGLRFPLWLLLVVVAALNVWFGIYVAQVRRRNLAERQLQAHGGDLIFKYQDYRDVSNFPFQQERKNVFHDVLGNGTDGVAVISFINAKHDAEDGHVDLLVTFPEVRCIGLARVIPLGTFGCSVTDIGIEHLSVLTKVEYLDISSAPITDRAMSPLSRMATITGLSLEETAITDSGLLTLSRLPLLADLNVRGTRVTSKGIEAFLKERPSCKVLWNDKR